MRPFRTPGPSQPWLRYGLVLGSWTVYLAAVWASQERHEVVLRPLATLPVVATGILLGWRAGLASSLAAPPAILGIHAVHGDEAGLWTDLGENAFRFIVGILLGWGSGFMAEQVQQGRRAQERLNAYAAAEQGLKAGLEEAQAIAHIGSWETDLTTGESRWSDEAWRILGLPKGSVRPSLETFLERVHPDDRERVRALASAGLAEMRIVEFECRVVRPDGHVRHLLARNVPTAVVDGRVVRLSGTNQDVTEAKAVQDRLRVSEERFREIAESIQEVFWVSDPARERMLYVSPAYGSTWGRSPAALHARPRDWLDAVHPADRARVAAAAARQAEGGYDEEYRIVAGDGLERWIRERAFPVKGPGGAVVRVVGVAEDVTARRRMQRQAADTGRRLAAVIAASPLPILQSDPQMRVTAWNPAAQRLFGWTEAETLGRVLPILPPEELPSAREAVAELRAGRSVVREDVPRLRKDGSTVRVSSYLAPLLGEDGAFEGAVAIVLDLSAQHEAEANRQRAQRLEEVAAFKTQFLNNAAHELATPLTPITLQVASLRKDAFGALTERQQDAVGLIDRNLHRLGRLVQDLLDAARLQSGHLRVALAPVAPGRIAQDVVASFAEKARQEGVTLAQRRLDSPLEAVGDETRLTQVLFNLVHNAIKFTPRGGRVEVALGQRGGEAVLSVSDTGVGMTGDQMARLFNPFTQVHDTAHHNVGGTGLGLYISRGIVEQHGGRLACRSDGRGKGTTFEVVLPLRPVEPPRANAAPRPQAQPKPQGRDAWDA